MTLIRLFNEMSMALTRGKTDQVGAHLRRRFKLDSSVGRVVRIGLFRNLKKNCHRRNEPAVVTIKARLTLLRWLVLLKSKKIFSMLKTPNLLFNTLRSPVLILAL